MRSIVVCDKCKEKFDKWTESHYRDVQPRNGEYQAVYWHVTCPKGSKNRPPQEGK